MENTGKPVVNDPPQKRIKLSSDNLLSNEMLNSSLQQQQHQTANNLSHTDSPHHLSNSVRLHHQQHNQTNSPSTTVTQSQVTYKKNSKNNLLSNDYESPTLVSNHQPQHVSINSRLSTDRILNNKSNISNNNLSTSASLLDATNDDAMSSK